MNYQSRDFNNIFLKNFQPNIQQINRIRENNTIRQLQNTNNSQNKNVDKIKEYILPEISIKKNNDPILLKKNYEEAKKNYDGVIVDYWKERTNLPYKNILKNEDYNKKISNSKDLIVHRVSNKDKIGLDQQFDFKKKEFDEQNNELKVIYSSSNKNEHKKKFQYNHIYKYRIQYDPKQKETEIKDHTQLKNDNNKYIEQKIQKENQLLKDKESIISSLVQEGIFNNDELEFLKSNDNNQTTQSIHTNNSSDKKDKYLKRQKNIDIK